MLNEDDFDRWRVSVEAQTYKELSKHPNCKDWFLDGWYNRTSMVKMSYVMRLAEIPYLGRQHLAGG